MASPPRIFGFVLPIPDRSNQIAAGNSRMNEGKETNQFHNLQSMETKRRPRPDYMENIQKCINPRSRTHCVCWLINAADNLGYTPQTLHLAIYCLDRYLSVKVIDCDEFEFVALTCLMIAAKYEEVRPAEVDFNAYLKLTANTCSRQDFIRMESAILITMDYGLSFPTTRTFLDLLFQQVHEFGATDSLKYIAAYIANVSLQSYAMIRFVPSMVAASSVFLARYFVEPCTSPWNEELQKYTKYEAADLQDCVDALRNLLLVRG